MRALVKFMTYQGDPLFSHVFVCRGTHVWPLFYGLKEEFFKKYFFMFHEKETGTTSGLVNNADMKNKRKKNDNLGKLLLQLELSKA